MTPKEISGVLAGMAETVAGHLLPGGKREGKNWCAGSVGGESGQSLRVCINGNKAGVWTDFSNDNKGGDLLDLWQQVKGLSFVDTLKEAKDYAGIQDIPELYTPKKAKKRPEKPPCVKPKNEVLSWFESRAIFEKSLNAYKVGQKDGTTIVFPFLSPSGDLELVKFRDINLDSNGKKKIWSNDDPDYHLWGWQAIGDNDREVVICEGEIDALSWYQQGFPALSVPSGAGNQTAWIENDFERLERFDTIYLSMDMDKAGQDAVKPIAERLGIDRCRIVNLGEFKDANEAHSEGIVLTSYILNAKTKDPDELSQLASHHVDIMQEFEHYSISGIKLPWSKTYNKIRLRTAEISIWAGVNSHGKSVSLSHVVVDSVSQGEKVCLASMEMKPRKLGRKMYQQVLGSEKPDVFAGQHIMEFLSDKVWLFEVYGTAKAIRILEVFEYARKRYGISLFIIDSLAKCGYGEDDYNGQKGFVDRLAEFAGKNNVHVILVVHMRKKEDEVKVPGKMDIKGTGAISDMVDNVFIWWRNKKKELAGIPSNEADAILNCVKQRETGEEQSYGLFFHKQSCQFLDNQDEPPKQYIN